MAVEQSVGVKQAGTPDRLIAGREYTNDLGQTVVRQEVDSPGVEGRLDLVVMLLQQLLPLTQVIRNEGTGVGLAVTNPRGTGVNLNVDVISRLGSNGLYLDLDQYWQSQAAYATIRQQILVS